MATELWWVDDEGRMVGVNNWPFGVKSGGCRWGDPHDLCLEPIPGGDASRWPVPFWRHDLDEEA